MCDKINIQKLGKRVCEARRNQKYTIKELAAILCIEPGSLANIESGNSMPSTELLFSISKALHVPVDYFLMDSLSNPKVAVDFLLFEMFASAPEQKNRLVAVAKSLIAALDDDK